MDDSQQESSQKSQDTKIELYGVMNRSILIYLGSQDNCKYIYNRIMQSDYVNRYHRNPHNKNPFKIVPIYPDCYVEKLKRGYEYFSMSSLKDGSDFKFEDDRSIGQGIVPNIIFGFSKRTVGLEGYFTPPPGFNKRFYYGNLFKNKEEATEVFHIKRVQTLLDDIWDK